MRMYKRNHTRPQAHNFHFQLVYDNIILMIFRFDSGSVQVFCFPFVQKTY